MRARSSTIPSGGPRSTVRPPEGSARLLDDALSSGTHADLDSHQSRWGAVPLWRGPDFLDELDRSGLRGRGGAWFPVATKWRTVRRNGFKTPVVIANGAEGEPASGKDRYLLTRLPHLVLDGASVAASTVGASDVFVHAPAYARPYLERAVEERRRRGLDPCVINIITAADSYLAGQESAVVNAINGRAPAKPSFVALRPVRERGVGGRPTLVQNVESLAHVALIARFGADWFRAIGTAGSPGTTLLTVTGRWPEPQIIEAPLGVPLGTLLGLDEKAYPSIQGVLLGGYGGGWVASGDALSMDLTEEEARASGARPSVPASWSCSPPASALSSRSAGSSASCRGKEPASAAPASTDSTCWPTRWSCSPTGRTLCTAECRPYPPCADWSRVVGRAPIPTGWPASCNPQSGCSATTPPSICVRDPVAGGRGRSSPSPCRGSSGEQAAVRSGGGSSGL